MITRITKTEFLEKNGHRLDGEEDIIENEFNLGNNPFKVGYLILEQE